MRTTRRMVAALAVLLLAAPLGGCLAAAAAGAGAGIYLTSQGASSLVAGSVPQAAARTLEVFEEMGIAYTGRSEEADEREVELRGTRDDLEVKVKVEQTDDGATQVTATARRNLVEWDREYARSIVQRIVERS